MTSQTIAVLHMFFLLMARHPEIQRKAQEEVDRVVGIDRLPEMSDRDSLPYINRIIREALRFAPVAPLVVHSPDEDDVSTVRSVTPTLINYILFRCMGGS